MTQKDKELLLKDLCARLPYSVKVKFNYIFTSPAILKRIDKDSIECDIAVCELEDVKPYLFPLSSMTEEQWKEYQTLKMTDWVEGDINGVFINAGTIIDWLNKNHFDYRGLIPAGLAIDATGLNIY